MTSFKIEYYPDRIGDNDGRKCFTIYYSINDWKRFEKLSDEEKKHLLGHIKRFEKTINIFKKRLK